MARDAADRLKPVLLKARMAMFFVQTAIYASQVEPTGTAASLTAVVATAVSS
jgi:hypothetical protein